ncbi:MAG: Tfp pilus assembly protein PilF [Planctomycetota bacterium]|jgi:Tfp pilus assembly protein PilF
MLKQVRRPVLIPALVLALCTACTITNTRSLVDSAGSEQILDRAYRQFQAGQYLQALEGYKVAAAAASTEGNDENFVIALAQTAHVHVLAGHAEPGREWLIRAQEAATESDEEAWATFLLARGVYERHDQMIEIARQTFKTMYYFAMENELYAQAWQAAHMGTLVNTGEAQIAWGRRGLDAAEAENNPIWIAHQWSSVASIFEDQGKFELALRAFEAARSLTQSHGDFSSKLKSDWEVGHALRLVGRNADATLWMQGVLKRAEEKYMLSRAESDAYWLGLAQQEMGELAAAAGRQSRAVGWLRHARKYFVEAGISDKTPDTMAQLDRRIHELNAGAKREER